MICIGGRTPTSQIGGDRDYAPWFYYKSMRILHYSLGLFPQRSGGLNRYATDLMHEQVGRHKVGLLYPSGYNPIRRDCFISRPFLKDGIECYRLVNSEPVSLLYGIRTPIKFYGRHIDVKSFDEFVSVFKPDVLHLHTLMGLPEDAVAFFKEKGIKIVYTSHDYFGLCPKVNFIDNNQELCNGLNLNRCIQCNIKAPSVLFLRVRNSKLAFVIRDLLLWSRNMIRF